MSHVIIDVAKQYAVQNADRVVYVVRDREVQAGARGLATEVVRSWGESRSGTDGRPVVAR